MFSKCLISEKYIKTIFKKMAGDSLKKKKEEKKEEEFQRGFMPMGSGNFRAP